MITALLQLAVWYALVALLTIAAYLVLHLLGAL